MIHVKDPVGAMTDRPLPEDEQRAVERFLYREARLLDAEAYDEWLGLVDPEIRYWMPGIETRRRGDPRGPFAYGDMAFFDDGLAELKIRIARYNEPTAWADNPQTRHAHIVTNIEAYGTADPSLVAVFSIITNVRNRNEKDQDVVHARREDLLRRHGDGFRIVVRRIFTVQNILLSKNLNTLL
jgi:ethylbenzene dioxygenase beta subunit